MRRSFLSLLAALALAGCVSGGESSSRRDGGASDDGATGGSGGLGGTGASDGGGSDATVVDSGEHVKLPTECAPATDRFVCNPLTNEGCDSTAGEACEYGIEQLFVCYPAPNDAEEGAACDWANGPFCKATLTCDSPSDVDTVGVCRRHCCDNTDCKATETCEATDAEYGAIGICR